MIISTVLKDCTSLDDVVTLINSGGTSSYSADEIAGQYACDAMFDAADNADDLSLENISGHLDYLDDNGARFNYAAAVQAARATANELEAAQ